MYSLRSAIVQRRDAAGGDYYVNGGKTAQNGVEAFLNYNLWPSSKMVEKSFIWISYALHNFHYKDFKQVNADYSGNVLPGEPKHCLSAGFDILVKKGWSASFHEYYSSKIALNDANTASAPSYNLLGLKLGYLFGIKNIAGQLFAGADNLLNQHYSLGNDINAVAGRYYNAAAGVNYYIGISFSCNKKQN
ncbi:MAG: hypothetical protein NVS1B13_16520 [Flavisolibacter sp.]